MMASLKISEDEKNEVQDPVRDLDDVIDISEDEPWTPISGCPKMTCGKYGKRAKLIMREAYKEDKKFLK